MRHRHGVFPEMGIRAYERNPVPERPSDVLFPGWLRRRQQLPASVLPGGVWHEQPCGAGRVGVGRIALRGGVSSFYKSLIKLHKLFDKGDKVRIVRVSRYEFELDNGSVYPITPPLEKDMTPDEFQKHYDYAAEVVRCLDTAGLDAKDATVNGPGRQD